MIKEAGITFPQYLKLHSHGVEMLLHYSADNMTKKQFSSIMKRYSKECGHAAILVPIIRGTPGKYMGPNAMKVGSFFSV